MLPLFADASLFHFRHVFLDMLSSLRWYHYAIISLHFSPFRCFSFSSSFILLHFFFLLRHFFYAISPFDFYFDVYAMLIIAAISLFSCRHDEAAADAFCHIFRQRWCHFWFSSILWHVIISCYDADAIIFWCWCRFHFSRWYFFRHDYFADAAFHGADVTLHYFHYAFDYFSFAIFAIRCRHFIADADYADWYYYYFLRHWLSFHFLLMQGMPCWFSSLFAATRRYVAADAAFFLWLMLMLLPRCFRCCFAFIFHFAAAIAAAADFLPMLRRLPISIDDAACHYADILIFSLMLLIFTPCCYHLCRRCLASPLFFDMMAFRQDRRFAFDDMLLILLIAIFFIMPLMLMSLFHYCFHYARCCQFRIIDAIFMLPPLMLLPTPDIFITLSPIRLISSIDFDYCAAFAISSMLLLRAYFIDFIFALRHFLRWYFRWLRDTLRFIISPSLSPFSLRWLFRCWFLLLDAYFLSIDASISPCCCRFSPRRAWCFSLMRHWFRLMPLIFARRHCCWYFSLCAMLLMSIFLRRRWFSSS